MHSWPDKTDRLWLAGTFARALGFLRWAAVSLGLMVASGALLPAKAQTAAQTASIGEVRFDLTDDAVRMSGNVRFSLSDAVQDVLGKGVPVYFVLETETTEKRWYWSDKTVFAQKRHVRLMYLPLTRKWRVNTSSTPFSQSGSTGVALNQNYDNLQAAINAIQRMSSWQVLERTDWDTDADFTVEVRFRLDVSQLQRPLQIGTSSDSGWNLSAQRKFRLTPQTLAK